MSKKILVPAAVVLLAAAAGGGWWMFGRAGDPMLNAQAFLDKGDIKAAQIEYRNAIKTDPNNAAARFNLGKLQLASGDPIAAEKELRAARNLNYDPTALTPLLGQAYLAQQKFNEVLAEVPAESGKAEQSAQHLVLRSMAQVGLNKLPEARASLDQAEQIAPKQVDARLTAARLAIATQDAALAERKTDEALAIEPKRGDALLLKGQIRAGQGDLTGAMKFLDDAVAASPTSYGIRLERANQYITMGQDAKALEDVTVVLAAEPRNAAASYLGAVLSVRAGKHADADAALTRLGPAIQRFPRGLYFHAISKSSIGQSESAVDMAQRYIARAPNDLDGVRLLARVELAANRPDRAVTALAKIVADGKADAETLDLQGRALAASGKPALASEAFQQASKLAPTNSTILTNLASTRMQMGDSLAASNALEKSLEIAPTQASAAEALVATALSSGDVARAQAALDRLKAQVGDTEAVILLQGLVRLAQQNLEGARVDFARAAQQFPQSLNARINLGKVLLLQNKRPEGEAVLMEVLAKDPANVQALNTMVQVLTTDNRAPQAVTLLEAARKAAPQNQSLTVGLSDILARSGNAKRALEVLESAKVDGQLSVALMLAQARAQVASGSPQDAIGTYRQVLMLQPTELEARRALTEALINTNDFAGASATLRDGLRTSPGNLGMMQALVAVEQRTSGLPAAVALAEDLRRTPANMPNASVLKGDAYLGARQFSDAAKAFLEEFRNTPSSLLALRAANAHGAANELQQASDVLRTWLRTEPADANAAQLLASLDITANRLPQAEANLGIVLNQRPNDGIALNNLAWVYQQRGDARAKATAQRAFLLAPGAETADTLGWILTTSGDATGGLPLLQQALKARPDDLAIQFHVARALRDTGKRDEAVAILKTVVADAKDFSEKAAARKLYDELTPKR